MRFVKTMGKRRIVRNMMVVLLLQAVLVGCGAVPRQPLDRQSRPPGMSTLDEILPRLRPANMLQEQIKIGLEALRSGKYIQASDAFRQGLRLDPGNGYLHFLNGLSYHLHSLSGNAKMRQLAKSGYVTALKFDSANYMAAYLLGQIYLEQRQYAAAQNQFAYGLLYAPDNQMLLKALAIASYYAHDIPLSRWAAEKAYGLDPHDQTNIRNLMFSQAAAGAARSADRLLPHYFQAVLGERPLPTETLNAQRLDATAGRLADWKLYHASNDDSIFGGPVSTEELISDDGDVGGFDDDFTGDSSESAAGAAPSVPAEGGSTVQTPAALPKMASVDVVILATEESRSQSRGINILEGLQTTLSGTLFEYNYNKSNSQGDDIEILSINPRFDLVGLEYNLNIFNDGVNKAEVLARPTLLATENSTSTFFSGGELHVELSSQFADGTLVDIPIGIKLGVTPEFLSTDTLKLTVRAERSFLEMQEEEVGFDSFSQTAKISVDATAILKFGETLMLSGLSETTSDKSNRGVPLLKDVPGVQYLFSRDEQLETKKSILILLTPRTARFAEDLTPEELSRREDLEKTYVTALKKKEKIANTNLNAAIAHLADENEFYRQFRTGDMGFEWWEKDDNLFGYLKRMLGFIYY